VKKRNVSKEAAYSDAIVYATAQMHHAPLYTHDADFAKLPDVAYVKK